MTTLKFHFDDGSEALAHYGKKGMHWGVWDENTREKYAANPDLIGEFAKMLNGGGGGASVKPSYDGKNPYEVHAYNQSFQDRKKMNPVEAGVRNLATVAGANIKKAKSDFEKSDVGRALGTAAGMAAHPKETAINYGRYTKRLVEDGSVDRAVEGVKKSVADFAKNAQKTISSAGSHAIENGARLIDSLFGTSFSKQSQARDARKRRRAQEKAYAAKTARQKRQHADRMETGYKRDMAKRASASSRRASYERHENSLKKRKRAMSAYNSVAKARKARTADLKNRARKHEMRTNSMEFKGDSAGRKKANQRTNDFYGYNGKRAQAVEANRRRRNSDQTEATMRREGYVRVNGKWRKPKRRGH